MQGTTVFDGLGVRRSAEVCMMMDCAWRSNKEEGSSTALFFTLQHFLVHSHIIWDGSEIPL